MSMLALQLLDSHPMPVSSGSFHFLFFLSFFLSFSLTFSVIFLQQLHED